MTELSISELGAVIDVWQSWFVSKDLVTGVDKLQKIIVQLEEECSDTEQACREYQTTLEKAESTAADLQHFINRQRVELDDTREDLLACKDRIQTLEEEDEAKDNILLNLEDELDRLQGENEALKEAVMCSQLQSYTLEKLQQENEHLRAEQKRLQFLLDSVRHLLETP